jgi:hypothetical protein
MCCSRNEAESSHEQRGLRILERFDAHQIGELILEQSATVRRIVGNLDRADRAVSLDFPNDADTSRQAVEGDCLALKVQCGRLIELLDERTARDDWSAIQHRADALIKSEEGRALRSHVRREYARLVLDTDYSAADVVEVMDVWDSIDAALTEDGLVGLVKALRQYTEKTVSLIAQPERLRDPASPLTNAQDFCVKAATVFWAAVALACCFTCWWLYLPGLAGSIGRCMSAS